MLQESSARSRFSPPGGEGKLHCRAKSNQARCSRKCLAKLRTELRVDRDQWIKTAVFAVIIADESVLRPNLNVAAAAIPVNKHGSNRRCVRIVNRQSFETITAHQLIAGFRRVGGFRIRIDHARRKQRM